MILIAINFCKLNLLQARSMTVIRDTVKIDWIILFKTISFVPSSLTKLKKFNLTDKIDKIFKYGVNQCR